MGPNRLLEKMKRDKFIIDEKWYDNDIYSNDEINASFLDLENPFQRYRTSNVLKIYLPKNDETIIDLGCGWGTFLFTLAPLCKEITGVDFSKKSIDLCKGIISERDYSNIKLVHASAGETGLPGSSYDVIISADLFEHLYPEDFEQTLDECKRLLKEGGKLVIWTPNRGHFFEILKNHNILLKADPGHVDYKSMKHLIENLKKRDFIILKNYYVESHLKILSRLERILMPFMPIMRRRIAILAEKSRI